MSVTVLLPSTLRSITGAKRVDLSPEGGTVASIIAELARQYPPLKEELLAPNGGLSEFYRVYINGEVVSAGAGLDARVNDGDEVAFLIPISGG